MVLNRARRPSTLRGRLSGQASPIRSRHARLSVPRSGRWAPLSTSFRPKSRAACCAVRVLTPRAVNCLVALGYRDAIAVPEHRVQHVDGDLPHCLWRAHRSAFGSSRNLSTPCQQSLPMPRARESGASKGLLADDAVRSLCVARPRNVPAFTRALFLLGYRGQRRVPDYRQAPSGFLLCRSYVSAMSDRGVAKGAKPAKCGNGGLGSIRPGSGGVLRT